MGWLPLAALAFSIVGSAHAAGIVVPAGGRLDAADGRIAVDCVTLMVAGTLDAGSAQIGRLGDVTIGAGGSLLGGTATLEVGGNWQDGGGFAAQAGAVSFVDGCRTTASIAGTDNFNNVSFSSLTGKRFEIAAGSTIEVSGQLVIAGSDAEPLQIVSSDLDQPVSIALGPTASVSIANSNPPAGAVIIGGGPGSGFGTARVIPSTSLGSLLLLIAAIASLSWRRRSVISKVSA